MELVWPIMKAMNANMIQYPVYWEETNTRQGQFEFGAFDEILRGARAAGLRVVPLWFATYKNGMMDYVPAWVKSDPVKYPHVLNPLGQPVKVLSPNSKTNMEADCKAFAALMKHIKEVDEKERTVIMVQVQNEAGIFGSVRDSHRNQQVLSVLFQILWLQLSGKSQEHGRKSLTKGLMSFFNAYYFANYINEVAKAGKAVYPLPMYINVWNVETDLEKMNTSSNILRKPIQVVVHDNHA
jgi:hypothetical protein